MDFDALEIIFLEYTQMIINAYNQDSRTTSSVSIQLVMDHLKREVYNYLIHHCQEESDSSLHRR